MSDSNDLEQVLNICLDRLRDGDTVEDCLARYPSYARRLAPLLRVAATLQRSDDPSMSAAGFRAVETHLLAHAAQLRARQRGTVPARQRGVVSGLLGNTRRLIAATVASVLLLCGVLSAGTVSAASASLPGSRLYPVKRTTEALVSSVAPTPQLRTRAHLAWAERRLREIEALMARDGVVDEAILADLEGETEQALDTAKQAGPHQLTAVITHTARQQMVLGRLLDEAPQAARPGLERALAASAQGQARAQSALERAGPGKPAARPGPPATPPGRTDKDSPDTGQGQGVGPVSGEGAGQGNGQGQDQAEDPGRGQGHGSGRDKDEPHPPNDGKGQGKDPAPGNGPGPDQDRGNGNGKPDKEDNPGQGRGKSK